MPGQTSSKSSAAPIFIAVAIVVVVGVAYMMLRSNDTGTTTQSNQVTMTTPSSDTTAEPGTSTTPEVITPSSPTTTAPVEKSFTVKGSNFSFTPAEIRVKKGDKVKITFTNESGFHDYVLDGYGVKTDQLAAGQSGDVTFTADKTGTFAYYCSVGNHRGQGMEGVLIVE